MAPTAYSELDMTERDDFQHLTYFFRGPGSNDAIRWEPAKVRPKFCF